MLGWVGVTHILGGVWWAGGVWCCSLVVGWGGVLWWGGVCSMRFKCQPKAPWFWVSWVWGLGVWGLGLTKIRAGASG